MDIILASKSPRRKELLRNMLDEMGLKEQNFEIIGADIDETRKPHENPVEYAKRLALEKAHQIMSIALRPSSIVIAADTIVVLGDKIFGKPRDKDDAIRMLTELSGKTHEVITGFSVLTVDSGQWTVDSCDHDLTKVTFKTLTPDQIQSYVNTDEPMDKAGAYAIQGEASQFIEKIQGSYSNVVGFPTEKISVILRDWITKC